MMDNAVSAVHSASARGATSAAVRSPDPVQRVAKEFEAMLLGQMFEAMFQGLGSGGPFGGGQSEATWRGFLVREYGNAVAEAGGFGVSRLVHAEVARLYGEAGQTA